MRFTRLKLINYIGIYNGLGLNEIEIDFTKCIYNTVVIKGGNGSGKSTILNALSVLPDSNDSFIPNKSAVKEIDIMSDNALYLISFIHDVRSSGTRMTTKAYIKKKDINGIEIELNPNGNVTSFRDLIYSEFSLDPNFVSLSQLGSEDRGIVDRTPAERKGYVSSIIDNIEVYNNMHKTLSKRISNLNVLRNRLIGKIDQLGNRTEIESRLKLLDNRINEFMRDKDKVIEELAEKKSMINLLDPDEKIQDNYAKLNRDKIRLENESMEFRSRISKILKDNGIHDHIDSVRNNLSNLYLSSKDKLSEYTIELDKLNNANILLLQTKESLSKENIEDEFKIDSFRNEVQLLDLENKIKELENNKRNIENIFNEMGFKDKVTLTKDEYLLGINSIMEIFEVINNIKSSQDQDVIQEAIHNFILKDIEPDIEKYDFFIEDIENEIRSIEVSIGEHRTLKELREKLNKRPPGCVIDECGFISDAIGVKDLDYDRIIDDMYNRINKLQIEIENQKRYRLFEISVSSFIYDINKVFRLISSNRGIINRLPNMENILDKKQLLHRIETGYDFGEIQKLYSYVEYCDTFEDYNIINNSLSNLYIKLDSYNEKINSISELENKVNTRREKIKELNDSILSNSSTISEYRKFITEYTNLSKVYSDCIGLNDNLNKVESDIIYYINNINKLENDMNNIKIYIEDISKLNSKLSTVQNQINPLLSDRDQLVHNLKLLNEYEEELEYVNGNYERTETVRYHCTPTTGIQIIYIEAYMNKTLSLTNELLKYVFDGEFELLPYIINDREFRIPVNAEGLPRDDISSLSNSQKSIISMIVSFVLLEQSSSKYNILKLDEIDSPLDETNRIKFKFLMNTLMDLLDVGQCIMISHNHELDLSNCDIIVLKTEPGQSFNGNVIYQY